MKKQWCIPPQGNADFVAHLEEVVDVYCRPYDPQRPVVCLDEVPKQLVSEVRQPLPARRGQSTKYDFEYQRQGVCNLFICCEPLRGWRQLEVTARRTKVDFSQCLQKLVDVHYPQAEKIVLVMDNLNTHTPASLYEAFAPAEAKRLWDRLEIHYTPKHGSWLNIAECELSVLQRQCLDRRIPDRDHLQRAVTTWVNKRKTAQAKVNWRFTTNDARIKLKRLYPVIQDCPSVSQRGFSPINFSASG